MTESKLASLYSHANLRAFNSRAFTGPMLLQDFLRNSRGINDGGDLPVEFMEDIYHRIVNNEIKMKVFSRSCHPACQGMLCHRVCR